MNLSQAEFVEQCLIKYRWEKLPQDQQWHDAHYPIPECLGGTETVRLWSSDHAIQGVLQSEEYQKCCLWGWERQYLEGKYLELYKKWKTSFGSINGKKGNKEGKRLNGIKARDSGQLDQARAKRNPAKLRENALANIAKMNKIWRDKDPAEVSKIRSEARKGLKWWWNPETDHLTLARNCPGPNYLNKGRPKHA
jgi:hypothetical protein